MGISFTIYFTFSLCPKHHSYHQEQHVGDLSHPLCHPPVSIRLRTLWFHCHCTLYTDVCFIATSDRGCRPRQDVHLCISELMNADNTDHSITVINLQVWNRGEKHFEQWDGQMSIQQREAIFCYSPQTKDTL